MREVPFRTEIRVGLLEGPGYVILVRDLVQGLVDDGALELQVLAHRLVHRLEGNDRGVAVDEGTGRIRAPLVHRTTPLLCNIALTATSD